MPYTPQNNNRTSIVFVWSQKSQILDSTSSGGRKQEKSVQYNFLK